MPPPRRRGANKAKANGHLRLGDLVLAKVKGFPYWPAMVRFLCLSNFISGCSFSNFVCVFQIFVIRFRMDGCSFENFFG